jgi:hypothetical protein
MITMDIWTFVDGHLWPSSSRTEHTRHLIKKFFFVRLKTFLSFSAVSRGTKGEKPIFSKCPQTVLNLIGKNVTREANTGTLSKGNKNTFLS